VQSAQIASALELQTCPVFHVALLSLVIGFAAVLGSHILPGQQQPSSDSPIIPVIGTVKAISGNQISVRVRGSPRHCRHG
jgi:hypothetical protein